MGWIIISGVTAIRSKLIMPQLPSTATMTERLRGLTQAIHEKPVVLVTAPAGYGKTTLIVTTLKAYKSRGGRICWYRLDETDRDLPSYYKHLTETLFPEDEKVWEEPRSYLDSCGDIAAQHQYINALFCQELWALENKHSGVKTFIVLDDFHHVRDVPEINNALRFFIDNLPPHCALIISSRCETNLLTLKGKESICLPLKRLTNCGCGLSSCRKRW